MSTDAGVAPSLEMTEEAMARRCFEPTLPPFSRAPWLRFKAARVEAEVEASASPSVSPGFHFDFEHVAVTPPPVQRKAAISSPDDPYEREADEVADKMMRMTDPAVVGSAPVAIHRRKCAQCEDEEGKRLQTRRAPSANPEATLGIGDAVRAAEQGGTPLPREVRSYFEPRFGHDFSRVRIHADSEAAAGARAVQAQAYTVRNDIVFGAGEYEPATVKGKRLLAHELTHVVQQAGRSGEIVQRQHDDDSRTHVVQNGETLYSIARRYGVAVDALIALNGLQSSRIQVQMRLRIPPAPAQRTPPAEPRLPTQPTHPQATGHPRPAAEQASHSSSTGVQPPASTAAQQPAQPTQPATPPATLQAARALLPEERTLIMSLVSGAQAAASPVRPLMLGSRFVLHDTAASNPSPDRERRHLEDLQRRGQGVYGEGAAAYVPSSGSAVTAHSRFFQARRPTATQFERAADYGSGGLAGTERRQAQRAAAVQREQSMRVIWNATQQGVREGRLNELLADSLSGTGVSEQGVNRLRNAAIAELALAQPAPPLTIHTAGQWVVRSICDSSGQGQTRAIAGSDARALDMALECVTLYPYFTTRDVRAATTTNVETVQQGGSMCFENDRQVQGYNLEIERHNNLPEVRAHPERRRAPIPGNRLAPLARPAYTDSQYAALVQLYLRAALEAGAFPVITTHLLVDRGMGDHCDPRCFDLGRLYREIAAALHHTAGSIYGVLPTYGLADSSANVWWHPTVCGPPP